MNNALCPMLLFLFWAINVESFQNGAAYRTLQHRKRIRNSNNNNAFKEPNLQYPLEYKSSTLVGDNELHGLWFPEMSNRTTESKAVAHDIPTATATAPPPAINNRHSSADWLYNLMTIPSSTVLRETKGPVLALAGWATFVSVLHQTFVVMGKRYAASVLSIPSSAHGFVVSSLGLLLVFRTNSAYQRFQEGRKIWENIHSTTRNLSRMIHLYRSQIGEDRSRRVKNLLAAFPYLLRHHVRSGCLCRDDDSQGIDPRYHILLHNSASNVVDSRYEGDKVSGGVTRVSNIDRTSSSRQCYIDMRDLPWSLLKDNSMDTLSAVAQISNKPLWVLDRLGQEMMGIPFGPHFCSRERMAFLNHVEKLTAAIGQCERIHQTSVPLNYARHALRGLSVWLFTLPFCFVKDLGLLTGPVTAVIAWLLFGIYQIGYHVEDPFQGSLRLSILCEAIRNDLMSDDDSAFHDNDEAFGTSLPQASFFAPDRTSPLQLVDLNALPSRDMFLQGLKP